MVPVTAVDLRSTAADLRLVLGQMARRLRVESTQPPGLTWSQEVVISRLDRSGPTAISALAEAEGVRSQSMGATIASLESKHLVARSTHPNDGRRVVVSLTETGRHALRTARAEKEQWLVDVMAQQLTTDEQIVLAQSVGLLRKLIEE